MKKLFNKVIVLVLVITFILPNGAFAKNTTSAGEKAGQPAIVDLETTLPVQENLSPEPGVQVIESTEDGVVLELVTPDFHVAEALSENGPCDLLSVTGYGEMDKSGWPRLPAAGAMIGIPQHAEPVLSVLTADFVPLPGAYDLCPVPQPIYDIDMEGQIAYKGEATIPDAAAYSTDSFYPAEIVEIAATGLLRSQRVVQLRFHPFQYNPVTGVVKHYRRIRVLVQFGDDGEITATNSAEKLATGEDPFDQLLAQIVANYDEAQQWQETPVARSTVPMQQLNAPVISQPRYKLTVDEDGLYEVTYTELAAAGIPVTALDPRTFMLYTQGTEVALYISGESDGVFDPEDAVIFYGEKMNTKYTDVNVYWLTWGGVNGLRMAGLDGAPTGSGVIPESFRTTQHIEQNKTYQSFHPSGIDKDRWYWNFIWATAPTTANYTTTLSAVAASPMSATVRGLFKGYDAVPQHHTQVYLNGNLIVDAVWAKQAEYFFEVAVPTSFLVEGTNTLTINAPLDIGITGDYFLVNWFEIDYDRAYAVAGDSLRFDSATAGTWEYALTGFITDTVQAFDVTTPTAPIRILNAAVELDGDAYMVRFEQTIDREHEYIAATSAQFKRVLSIMVDQFSDLRAVTNGADYIIITHGNFYTDVQPLVDFRAVQGLRALVVDVQDIYDEFADGIFDPIAIRDFLAYAYVNWIAPAPAYVLLMGDGNYDFKNTMGRGEMNYIPPFLADVDPWMGEVAADNRYVCVNGTDVFPDMHLGRLPVKTSAEAQAVVNKILAYEQNPATDNWNQNVLFATDNPDSAGDFYAYSDAIANNYLPAPYTAQKVYYGRTHTNASLARTAIINAINEGRLIVNYVGHGAVTYWASEQLFRRADVAALTNAGRLPFIVPMACLDGYYIYPSGSTDFSSMAEALVRAPAKGAIAAWSSTGMGTASAHDYLNKGLFKAIFSDDIIQLGPATLQGKLYLYARTGWYNDQIDTYLLFGDPAVRLNVLPADVSLTQTIAVPDMLLSGSDITYTLSFTNSGPATAHHVVIDNVLSTALVNPAIVATGAAIITRTGSSLVWDVADLAAGEGGTITLIATISETFTGLLINIVSMTTSASDSDDTNNAPDPMATAVNIYSGDVATAVDLVSFTAMPVSATILLEWETANELDMVGFNLYRAESVNAPKSRLNSHLIPPQSPGGASGAVYAFIDNTATPATTYVYWLEDISLRGGESLHGPVTAFSEPQILIQYRVFLPLIFRTP